MPRKKNDEYKVIEEEKFSKEFENRNKEKNLDEDLDEKIEEVKEENKQEEKALVEQKNMAIDEVKLERIEEEIKKQTELPEERKQKIYRRVFSNLIIAVAVVIYFIFVNLGYTNLEPLKYLKDIQVFSMVMIVTTIIIFEKAYKYDSSELTIYGIEFLMLSIATLMTIYIGINFKEKYRYIINTISMFFAIYYVGKSIYIYVKQRKKALKKVSDIHKIGRI